MTAHDELLYWANINYHPLYERAIRENYEEENGPHFNEKYAKEAVSEMYSIDPDGKKNSGEHWKCDEVKSVLSSFPDKLEENDTCWDAYVACNMWWHDLHKNYSKHGLSDKELIDDALTWAFQDSDSTEGKIWHYVYM